MQPEELGAPAGTGGAQGADEARVAATVGNWKRKLLDVSRLHSLGWRAKIGAIFEI